MGPNPSKAIAALALLAHAWLPAMAVAQPTAERKAEAANATAAAQNSRQLDVARLQDQIRRLAALSPLTIEGATALFGVRLINETKRGPGNGEWQMTPTRLLAGGRAGVSAGYVYVEIQPSPSLQFSFEDLAALLMDAPYAMRGSRGHHGEVDVEGTVTDWNYHIFKVKAGEVRLEIPVSRGDGTTSWASHAIKEGYAIARGELQPPVLLKRILVTSDGPIARWRGETHTLRSLRSLVNKRKPSPKTPPVR